jgi:ribonuclease T
MLVFVKEFLCALCVFAVKTVFMVEHCLTNQLHRSVPLPAGNVAKPRLIGYPSTMNDSDQKPPISQRFRGFLPVVVDVETAGFNAKRDALLEIAAVTLDMDGRGNIAPKETFFCHVQPFPGANLDEESLRFNGIDPYHPFRMAKPEYEALESIFKPVRRAIKEGGCKRAILVGHNSFFDLSFVNAAVQRTGIKRNPFHPFSTFDTVSLAGLAYGQTVLARAVQAAGLEWDSERAHSAVYDTERTADLFCAIFNRWNEFCGDRAPPRSQAI